MKERRGSEMQKYDLVIIDSGVDASLNIDNSIHGIAIKERENEMEYYVDDDFSDLLGHGTAIYSIIKLHNKNATILNIRIFEKDAVIDERRLLFALNYIYDNIDVKIINMSLGLPMPMHKNELQKIIDRLYKKGVIVVSAFDNSGCISFPAAFKNVFGVASHSSCKRISDFVMLENSPINIYAKGDLQRVSWLNQSYIIMGGNSFACAHFTGILLQTLFDKGDNDLYNCLKNKAMSTYTYSCLSDKKSLNLHLFKKAALVPFNKEMHSLVRYEELLNFEIVDVYDSKYTARVGSSTNTLLNINKKNNYKIKNLENIDWNSFDSIIIGHLDETTKGIKTELLNRLVQDAIFYDKNIYSFDRPNVNSDYAKLYFPSLYPEFCNNCTAGKFYKISKPVLCVVGTSSKQGKFSLQLELRKQMSELGYKIGQLGTEPSSLLFGMSECFHFGYNSNCELTDEAFMLYVNQLVNKIADTDCDIILSGCQSETLHQDIACVENLVFPQLKFLIGLQPDAVILVVNPYDEMEYIKKTIMLLEAFVNADVIAIVLYPMNFKNINSGIYGGKYKMSIMQSNIVCHKLHKIFDLPVYSLDDINGLVGDIENYFQ